MKYIRRFQEISHGDTSLVGGKNASLGEMFNVLQDAGVKVPDGFAITADAYRYLLEHNKLTDHIRDILATADLSDVRQLAKTGCGSGIGHKIERVEQTHGLTVHPGYQHHHRNAEGVHANQGDQRRAHLTQHNRRDSVQVGAFSMLAPRHQRITN